LVTKTVGNTKEMAQIIKANALIVIIEMMGKYIGTILT
jgi:hypothetical protein